MSVLMVSIDWKYLLSWRPSMSPRFRDALDKWILPCALAFGVGGLTATWIKDSPVRIESDQLYAYCSPSMFPSDLPLERPFNNIMWYGLWIEHPRIDIFDNPPKPVNPSIKRHR
jgi:hypothetical protein